MNKILPLALLLFFSVLIFSCENAESTFPNEPVVDHTIPFKGTYTVTEQFLGTKGPIKGLSKTNTYEISIKASKVIPNTVEISNFASIGPIEARVETDTSIVMFLQVLDEGHSNISIAGNGTLKDSLLTFSYTASNNDQGFWADCKAIKMKEK